MLHALTGVVCNVDLLYVLTPASAYIMQETVTVDLYIIRKIGHFLRQFPQVTTDVVALLDEWAARFFDELDYVKEGQNAEIFAAQMAADLPQVAIDHLSVCCSR
eukprot:GHUV01056082.1.p1 GENE.GHUV01056082.1~~GHUV01056082.1.p1  ORF type:complete len:104 (-),score=22.77 GHUV01056082.1:339-650(-)